MFIIRFFPQYSKTLDFYRLTPLKNPCFGFPNTQLKLRTTHASHQTVRYILQASMKSSQSQPVLRCHSHDASRKDRYIYLYYMWLIFMGNVGKSIPLPWIYLFHSWPMTNYIERSCIDCISFRVLSRCLPLKKRPNPHPRWFLKDFPRLPTYLLFHQT